MKTSEQGPPSARVVFKITMKEFYFHQKWYLSLSNNYILLLNLCLTPINLRLIVCNNYLLCLFDVLLSVVSCICLKKEVKIRNIVKEVQNLLRNLKTWSLFSFLITNFLYVTLLLKHFLLVILVWQCNTKSAWFLS